MLIQKLIAIVKLVPRMNYFHSSLIPTRLSTIVALSNISGVLQCLGQINNKEKAVGQHHYDHMGDLRDPFEGDQIQRSPYNSGRMDLYSQRKQALSLSANPYEQPQHQRQMQVQSARRSHLRPQRAVFLLLSLKNKSIGWKRTVALLSFE